VVVLIAVSLEVSPREPPHLQDSPHFLLSFPKGIRVSHRPAPFVVIPEGNLRFASAVTGYTLMEMI